MTDNVLRFSIAIMVFVGFFGYLYITLVIPIPTEMQQGIKDVQSALIPLLTLVLGWYFGSSAGSSSKDKVIADLSKTP